MIIIARAMTKIMCKITFLIVFIISTESSVYAQGNYQRYGGSDRYDTAMKITQKYSSNSGYAILVSGENFPDALCACPLSQKYDAPIILTTEKQLDNRAAEQLKNYKVTKVFIVGKTISEDVENSIKNMRIDCERIGGKDRYETAMLVANYVGIKDRIMVVSGENYPDALSAAPIAAIVNIPIILVSNNSLPESVRNGLIDKKVNNTYIIGSEGAVSEAVKSQFKNAERISGKDRYSTNIAIINRFSDVLDMSTVYIASANNFPDSLAGSALVQKSKSPLVLVSEGINEKQQNEIKGVLAASKNTYIFGGEGAVSINALYLIGLEQRPIEQKSSTLQPPEWTSSFGVMNADETTRVSIRKLPNSSSEVVGSTYGSLAEVKVLDGVGEYYYVEILDYDTLNNVKGYVPKYLVKTVTPSKSYHILVDKGRQRVDIFSEQTLIKEFICSTGLDETPTPSGRFLTGSKGPAFNPSEDVVCYLWTRINNNFLFHSVLYDSSGYLIQSEYDKLGSKASHGCIRLPYEDAKWIQDYIPKGTLVTIKD